MVELRGAHMRALVAVRGYSIVMMVMAAIAVVIVVMMMIAVAIMIVVVGTLGVLRWIVVGVLVIIPVEIMTVQVRIEGKEALIAPIQRQALALHQLPHLFFLPLLHLIADVGAAATGGFALGHFLSVAQLQFP